MEYPCPCCGNILEDDEPHNWEICSICMWEDDPVQFKNPNYAGGANDISLNLYSKRRLGLNPTLLKLTDFVNFLT